MREPKKGACNGVRNPHFLLDDFCVVAAGNCSRSGAALNENAGRAHD
jgi:hypothetical protein